MDVSLKLLHHSQQIASIADGGFMPPVMVDIDPVDGACNLDCEWCCQATSRASRPAAFMSEATMDRLGYFSYDWGIKAWRISGDSEPLLNKHIDVLLNSGHVNGIDMGLITNGSYLDRPKLLKHLTWLGVSLDATSASTWSKLKRAAASGFHKIIDNVKRVRAALPDLDITIKFLRWRSEQSLGKREFSTYALPVLNSVSPEQPDNVEDAEALPQFAKELGCNYLLKDSYPKDFAKSYKFTKCHATPLGGVFAADHRFHLCCDARSIFVLTDDYTRDEWRELPRLWGSAAHKALIAKIEPQKCLGCAKHKMNDVLENVVLPSGHAARQAQLNFI